jgi:hypothetical protein
VSFPGAGDHAFTIKDSGERQQFDSGMVRDVTDDKIDYTLALDGPMFKRLAIHLTKGAQKYAKRNWMKARGQAELDRFKESATRHFMQWLNGDTDEDHAAAVLFNINGAEYVKERFDDPKQTEALPITRHYLSLPTQQRLRARRLEEDDGA